MPWNPEIYNRYKDIRFKPFYDLLSLIVEVPDMKGIDLGCGTGEQTATITHRFKSASILGIDSSAEMLEKSKEYENNRLKFQLQSIEDAVHSDTKWDLVFSNAALQWLDNHQELFPDVINLLNPGGQLAIQMPVQTDNVLNQLLLELVQEDRYAKLFNNFVRESPVLSMDEYAQILFENGIEEIDIMQKVYPIIAENADQLLEFISGSALIPYLELLEGEEKTNFVTAYKEKIENHFHKFPTIYAFKRLLIYGKKGRGK